MLSASSTAWSSSFFLSVSSDGNPMSSSISPLTSDVFPPQLPMATACSSSRLDSLLYCYLLCSSQRNNRSSPALRFAIHLEIEKNSANKYKQGQDSTIIPHNPLLSPAAREKSLQEWWDKGDHQTCLLSCQLFSTLMPAAAAAAAGNWYE